jgi:MFS family permease
MAVLLYMLWRLAAAGSCLVSGRCVDRYGPVPVMAGGVLALLFAYAGFAFSGGAVAELAVCFLVAGASSGAVEAAEHVGVAQVAPVELRWSAFGLLSSVRSFGRMTATIGATVVWTVLGAEWGLLLASPLMLAAVLVMARGFTRSEPSWRLPRVTHETLAGVALALLPAATVLLVYVIGLLLVRP